MYNAQDVNYSVNNRNVDTTLDQTFTERENLCKQNDGK
jgi:hypothetical protein